MQREGELRCIKLLKSGEVCYLGLKENCWRCHVRGCPSFDLWAATPPSGRLWDASKRGWFEASYVVISLLQSIKCVGLTNVSSSLLLPSIQLRILHTVSLLTCETSSSGELPLLDFMNSINHKDWWWIPNLSLCLVKGVKVNWKQHRDSTKLHIHTEINTNLFYW